MITQQNFHDGNLREAAKVARNDYAVPAKTTMTGARAEMGRKPLDQVLSLSFEKHEVVLQFDMSQLHSQCHQLKSPVNMPFVMWLMAALGLADSTFVICAVSIFFPSFSGDSMP